MTRLFQLPFLLSLAVLIVVLIGCNKKEESSDDVVLDGPYTYIKLPGGEAQKVFYQVREGLAVAGDVIIGKQQDAEMIREKNENGPSGRGAFALSAAIYTGFKWPKATVYYEVGRGINRTTVKNVVTHMNEKTGIKFIESTTAVNRISIQSASWCDSYVGFVGGVQVIHYSDPCGEVGLMHEFGHALGLFHEFQRPDRNNYVKVLYKNMQPGLEYEFQIVNTGGDTLGKPMDVRSVMMYGPTAGSANGQPVMTLLNGSTNFGPSAALSVPDQEGLQILYPRSENAIGTIPDQILEHGTRALTVNLNLTAEAKARLSSIRGELVDSRGEAHRLYQLYRFRDPVMNFGGADKWLEGVKDGQVAYFMILPGGLVYDSSTGNLVGDVGDEYYADPRLLINAPAPTGSLGSVTESNGVLTVTLSTSSFTGARQVLVTFTETIGAQVFRTFKVTAPNKVPTIASIAAALISHTLLPFSAFFTATDGDGDSLNATITAKSEAVNAYEVKQKLNIGDYWLDVGGYVYMMSQDWYTSYYLYPSGLIYDVNNPQKAIADVGPNIGKDPLKLINAKPVSNNVTASIVNGKYVLQATGSTPPIGTNFVKLTVDDGWGGKAVREFKVTVADGAPVMAAIAAKSISHNQDYLTMTLAATDPDGDAITYTAKAVSYAYWLKSSLGIDPSTMINYGSEWWVASATDWFAILSDGTMISVYTGIKVAHPYGKLLFERPEILLYAANTSYPVTVSGSTLKIDPPAGFSGSLQVTVTASAGGSSIARTFTVSVTNAAPSLAALTDLALARNAPPISLNLSPSDADGDTIAITVPVIRSHNDIAYELVRSRGWINEVYDYSTTQKGISGTDGMYMIDNAGKVFDPNGILIEQLDKMYFNTDLIFNAPAPDGDVPATWTLSNGVLTLTPDSDFAGPANILIQATDGIAITSRKFRLTVKNTAPTLGTLAAKTTTVNQPVSYTLVYSDAEKDAVDLEVEVLDLEQVARKFDEKYGFVYYPGYDGPNTKTLNDKNGLWYAIDEDGTIIDLQTNAILAQFNATYYANPEKLSEARIVTNPSGTGTISGTNLTVKGTKTGDLIVKITASDGIAETMRQVRVVVQ